LDWLFGVLTINDFIFNENIITLRTINSIGAILFIFYGIMLKTSWPIIITNLFILGVNLIYLTQHFTSKTKK